MKPEFPHASEDFKKVNPQIFSDAATRPFTLNQEPQVQSKHEVKLEKELQERIRSFLELNGTVVIRSRMDRKTGTPVGTPDLLFCIKGRAVAIECKLPGKRATPEQDNMMARMSANGWLCAVIDDFDKALEFLRKNFA